MVKSAVSRLLAGRGEPFQFLASRGRAHYAGDEEQAQVACAAAADQASRVVLQQRLEVSALICKRFQEEMKSILSKSIPGVRVTKIQTPGIRPKRFPDGDEVRLRGFPADRGLSAING